MKNSPSCTHVLQKHLEFGHFTLLFCRGQRRNKPKCKTHVQSDCFLLIKPIVLWRCRCRRRRRCSSSLLANSGDGSTTRPIFLRLLVPDPGDNTYFILSAKSFELERHSLSKRGSVQDHILRLPGHLKTNNSLNTNKRLEMVTSTLTPPAIYLQMHLACFNSFSSTIYLAYSSHCSLHYIQFLR